MDLRNVCSVMNLYEAAKSINPVSWKGCLFEAVDCLINENSDLSKHKRICVCDNIEETGRKDGFLFINKGCGIYIPRSTFYKFKVDDKLCYEKYGLNECEISVGWSYEDELRYCSIRMFIRDKYGQ